MDLSEIPILDHHAHPLLKAGPKDAAGFQQWFTESTSKTVHVRDVPHSLFFRTAVRWLAERLDCRPKVEAILEARAAVPEEGWIRQLFEEANIGRLFCDYGYGGPAARDHVEMQRLLPCPVEPILRLESLAEQLIREHATFDAVLEAFEAVLRQARADGYAALKSVVAYRSGLDVRPAGRDEALTAFRQAKDEVRNGASWRLANRPLNDYLLHMAVDICAGLELPLQFHTGFGDEDADLRWANPLHLRTFIEQSRAPLVLLHAGWPFYREAAHLAAIYPNVWLDLSLAIPFVTTGIPAMLRDVMGVAPLNKLLFATDAFSLPEIYWLAARWGRWGLSKALVSMRDDGFLSADEAWSAAEAILWSNAQELYQGAAHIRT